MVVRAYWHHLLVHYCDVMAVSNVNSNMCDQQDGNTSLHTPLPSVMSLTMKTESGQLKELTLPPQTTISQCPNVSEDVATTSS